MNAYRRANDDDSDDDPWDEDDSAADGWGEDDADRDDSLPGSDEEPTVPCPYCGAEVLEDSPYCPACDRYISGEDHAGPSRPLWVMATALVCLGVAVWWVFAAR